MKYGSFLHFSVVVVVVGWGEYGQGENRYQKSFEVFRFKPTLCGMAGREGCEKIHRLANSQNSFFHLFSPFFPRFLILRQE